jgi:6-phosphogluconolactonase
MPNKIEVLYTVDATAEALANRTAAYILNRVLDSVSARGNARVAISGGHGPIRTFQLLAGEPFRRRMPWEKLEFYWVDERSVPPGNPGSNYGMAREALLDKVPLKESQIFRIKGELDPEEAAAQYEAAIRRSFRLEGAELPIFDLLALGMGTNAHTASLFPYSDALNEILRIAVANHVPDKEYPWRVTLTWPVINHARDIFFEIAGADKAAPLKEVLLGPYDPEKLPSQLIQPRSGRLTFLLDSAAAALLPKPAADGTGRLEISR